MLSWLAIQIPVASETTGVAAGGDVSLFDDSASSILLTVSALIRCISEDSSAGQCEPAKPVNDGAVFIRKEFSIFS
jgi:hypothetical protein